MEQRTTIDKSFKSEPYQINMGPQHPATHGVLNLLLTIDGEIIQKVEPDLGYIHRSIEKMCERDSYQQIVHLTDRMDYLSSNINNEAVCLVVENALELEIPERVELLLVNSPEYHPIVYGGALWEWTLAL